MDIAEQYFKEVNKGFLEWNFLGFQYKGYIKQRKIRNARRIFAPYDDNEETPLLVVDVTIFKSGKRGVFITNSAVYY